MGTKNTTIKLSENCLTLLRKRYLKKDDNGKPVETPEDMFRRVAMHVAAADALYRHTTEEVSITAENFYDIMTNLYFLPNSPTLMNAGRRLGQLSACFVLPIEDSIESIYDGIKHAAIIHKSGGGTGFSFSRLRPSGDRVGSTKGISSGPISFMEVYDKSTGAIKQGGTRRGANMGILRVDHPDILDFIVCKDSNASLNNFNISIGITEKFMQAVENKEDYEITNPKTKKTVRKENAQKVFELIIKQAWKNGEPGIVFLDKMNVANPTPALGEIESTNPCGEQPLMPYESCNLGSINLAKMVNGYGTDSPYVDFDLLEFITKEAVHFLDNVIDVNKYPLQMIEDVTKGNRKIGLGIMGWADMLVQMRIPYNSEEGLKLAEEVMGFINKTAWTASAELAAARGAFQNYGKSIFCEKEPVRNATVTTIAPTGSLAIMADCANGIEPLFAVSFTKTVMEGTKLIETNRYFFEEAERRGFDVKSLQAEIAKTGSIAHIEILPDDMKNIFVTAHDITPADHIKMQAAFQKYVDNAVSKTVNFSEHAKPEDIQEAYTLAYTLGCKGVTVYRNNAREKQVLSRGAEKTEPGSNVNPVTLAPRKRPTVIRGSTKLYKTGCGNLYVTVNEDDKGSPFEVFTNIGKAGGCTAASSEACSRLISLCLRSNIDSKEIIHQLKGISCHQPQWNEGGKVLSCSDAIAKAVEAYRPSKVAIEEDPIHIPENGNGNGNGNSHGEMTHYGACPECGGPLEHEGGCQICKVCMTSDCL